VVGVGTARKSRGAKRKYGLRTSPKTPPQRTKIFFSKLINVRLGVQTRNPTWHYLFGIYVLGSVYVVSIHNNAIVLHDSVHSLCNRRCVIIYFVE
jgi:hypothetical protein